MKKTAIIDIDNTLWSFSDQLYLEMKKIRGDFPPPERWISYDHWEEYCPVEDFVAAINAIHRRQDSETFQPYPESRPFLASLRQEGFRIVVASHRAPATRGPTERWLARHGLPYDELHLSLDKTILFPGAYVVVDDAPPTLAKAVACGVLGAGLLCPWNRAYAGNGFGLFDSLAEVLDYILTSPPR